MTCVTDGQSEDCDVISHQVFMTIYLQMSTTSVKSVIYVTTCCNSHIYKCLLEAETHN